MYQMVTFVNLFAQRHQSQHLPLGPSLERTWWKRSSRSSLTGCDLDSATRTWNSVFVAPCDINTPARLPTSSKGKKFKMSTSFSLDTFLIPLKSIFLASTPLVRVSCMYACILDSRLLLAVCQMEVCPSKGLRTAVSQTYRPLHTKCQVNWWLCSPAF